MSGRAVDWSFAERVAAKVTAKDPYEDSYHADSLVPDFEELTAQAEKLVAAETGLVSLDGPARAKVADRSDWVRANLASFQRLLKPLLSKMEEKIEAGPSAAVGARAAGAEVGFVLGWMSGRVLGQYDLLVVDDDNPEDQDIVYYVGPNVLALEKKYGFPPREFRLWLALHEVTHRAQFTGVPWMREHFLSLVNQLVGSVEPDEGRFNEAMGRAFASIKSGKNPLDDGGIAGLVASNEQKAVIDQLGGLMSLLEGHGDITMDRAGEDLLPSADRFGRVLRQRRQSANKFNKLFQKVLGLEAKMAQYEQGEAFINFVEGAEGRDFMDRVWQRPENLPTISEIRDPQTWIDRIADESESELAVSGA